MKAAILAAADNIEKGSRLGFYAGTVPHSEDGFACPLAWIVFYAGYPYQTFHAVISDALGEKGPIHFYDELTRLLGAEDGGSEAWDVWRDDSDACAKALRLYADKHYPEADQ